MINGVLGGLGLEGSLFTVDFAPTRIMKKKKIIWNTFQVSIRISAGLSFGLLVWQINPRVHKHVPVCGGSTRPHTPATIRLCRMHDIEQSNNIKLGKVIFVIALLADISTKTLLGICSPTTYTPTFFQGFFHCRSDDQTATICYLVVKRVITRRKSWNLDRRVNDKSTRKMLNKYTW